MSFLQVNKRFFPNSPTNTDGKEPTTGLVYLQGLEGKAGTDIAIYSKARLPYFYLDSEKSTIEEFKVKSSFLFLAAEPSILGFACLHLHYRVYRSADTE
jgi:hypothetical protein